MGEADLKFIVVHTKEQQVSGEDVAMQFVITAYDGPNMLEKRMEVRPRHLQNLSRLKGKILCAGGILDEAGKMKGSVEYLKSEPYIQANVWADVKAEPMNVVILNGEKVGK